MVGQLQGWLIHPFTNMAKGCHHRAPTLHGNKMAAGIPASCADTISRGKREGYLFLVSFALILTDVSINLSITGSQLPWATAY